MPAIMGAEALVPPKTSQPDWPKVSKTATPVDGSATAETSEMVRWLQPGSVCQACFLACALQPLPVPTQALSLQPRGLLALRTNVVPPTAITVLKAAGSSVSKPLSPALVVMATPG